MCSLNAAACVRITRRAGGIAAPQALLDVYTIKREIGRLEDFSIGLVGDLANGRTVRSLAYLLSMYPGVKMYFVAPEVVRMKEDIKDYLTRWADDSPALPAGARQSATTFAQPRGQAGCRCALARGDSERLVAVLLQEGHRMGGGGGSGSRGGTSGCAISDTNPEGKRAIVEPCSHHHTMHTMAARSIASAALSCHHSGAGLSG
jgi:hypothetical protein